MVLMSKMFCCNMMMQLVTYLMPQPIYCVKRLMAVSLAGMVMLVGWQKAAIEHRYTIFSTKKLQLDTVGLVSVGWLQQDDATCQISHPTTDLLRQTVDGSFISRDGHISWLAKKLQLDIVELFSPPRSCNWTSLNSFLHQEAAIGHRWTSSSGALLKKSVMPAN